MMPEADMVAFRGSVSNHWSRKSAALMVISWTKAVCWRRGNFEKVRRSPARGIASRGSGRCGSSGTIPRIGLMKRAISTIRRPYSS